MAMEGFGRKAKLNAAREARLLVDCEPGVLECSSESGTISYATFRSLGSAATCIQGTDYRQIWQSSRLAYHNDEKSWCIMQHN